MALSKSAVNKKYDELRAQLKSGELSQKAFKTAADRLYTMYHSKEAKAQRAKAAAKPKVTKKVASTSKPKPAAPKKDTATKPQSKTGVYGKPLPSNPKLKSQPKPKPKKNVRGSGVKKTGKKVNVGKALQSLSDKFKLTRKAGEVFTVGNMRYVSNGRGGIRSSQRIR